MKSNLFQIFNGSVVLLLWSLIQRQALGIYVYIRCLREFNIYEMDTKSADFFKVWNLPRTVPPPDFATWWCVGLGPNKTPRRATQRLE